MKIYFDGGCKPNPGKMEVAIVLDYENGTVVPFKQYLDHGTNNEAEWLAFLWALDTAVGLGDTQNTTIHGDSQIVCNGAIGTWKVNADNLKPFKAECDRMKVNFKGRIVHLRRHLNLAGLYLEGKL
jgi:ribonuclease HI